jgi:hypothetical protein
MAFRRRGVSVIRHEKDLFAQLQSGTLTQANPLRMSNPKQSSLQIETSGHILPTPLGDASGPCADRRDLVRERRRRDTQPGRAYTRSQFDERQGSLCAGYFQKAFSE